MHTRRLLYLFILTTPFLACTKGGFLDTKPDQSISIPTNIEDCQKLMDNDIVMNGYGGTGGYPSLGITGSDDFYVNTMQYAQYTLTDQHAVIWADKIYSDDQVNDWDLPYRTILYSNVVLKALTDLHPTPGEQAAWNNAAGSAYFFRAYAYHQLAQIFTPPYDSVTADQDMGLPLRNTTDIGEKFTRVSVRRTYDQIISDLLAAIPLLPDVSLYSIRPSRAAAYGMLSRVYLSARAYSTALLYADSCLQIRPALMRYDTIVNITAPLPFSRSNPEVILSMASFYSGPAVIRRSFTDSNLYASYQPNDLRKTFFFKNGRFFFGRYDQNGYLFSGIATDELYLARAECYARTGNITAAMTDLNSLLVKRWATGTFTPLSAIDAGDALRQILEERRKELLYRGLRWSDLRRLNKDAATAITLTRIVNGVVYTLPPNDARYVYPIPEKVISSNSGMQQNQR